MKTESMSLNPLEILNKELSISRSRAEAYITGIQSARSKMEREGFQYPPNAGPAEVATAGVEFDNKTRELRNIQMNFRPAEFVMHDLDDKPETKTMLEAALAFLRSRHKAYVMGTKQTMLAKIAEAFTVAPVAHPDHPPKREPVSGPFGRDALAPLDVEMERIAKLVEAFPDLKSLTGVVSEMNALNSRLELPEKRPAAPKRQDKPFVVVECPQAPQPDNAYTNRWHRPALPRPNQPDPARPLRAQRIIVGA